eukprot:Nk52_evm22s234 gene=Nk52_evmTU22s234
MTRQQAHTGDEEKPKEYHGFVPTDNTLLDSVLEEQQQRKGKGDVEAGQANQAAAPEGVDGGVVDIGELVEDVHEKSNGNKKYAFDEPSLNYTKLVEIPDDPEEERKFFSWKKFARYAGPGFLMSIAYLDPGNIESDLQAGAQAGYQLLWVLMCATILGLILQMMAAKLGIVTGRHLAEHCREQYSGKSKYVLWIMTEIAIIGSDIQEVVGSAIAINILSVGYIPLWAGVLITAADTFTFLFLESYGIRKLEFFFISLIAIMAISFGIQYCITAPDQVEVLKGLFVPRVSNNVVTQAVGIIGAVIMPHNIYLHSALVQSRKIDRKTDKKVYEAIFYCWIESSVALLASFIINLFVVSVFADAFFGTPGADDIGLSGAGDKLAEKYGEYAKYIWACGIFAAGQSSTMTGTYVGQFVMQGFLDLRIAAWKRVLITRCAAIVPSVTVAVAAESCLDTLDEYLNVLQSVQLPFALLPVLYMTSHIGIMGKFVNTRTLQTFVTAFAVLIIGVNVYLIIVFADDVLPHEVYIYAILAVLGVLYFAFILRLYFADAYKRYFNRKSN